MALPGSFSAVLIGVHDYSLYDRAAGLPPGTSDLMGTSADAREWAALAKGLGAEKADIRVLSSDAVEGGDRGRKARPPTRANILAACGWLRERLVGSPHARGLLVFAGHGAVDEKGDPVLCPADVRPDGAGGLAGTLRFDDLERALTAGGRRVNLTAFLDTCHAAGRGASAPGDRVRVLGARSAAASARRLGDGFPVFNAARADQPSYELPVGEDWRGAFSWACLRVIQRWGITRNDQGMGAVSISHQELNTRVATLLRAMGFEQDPVYSGPGPEQALFISLKKDSAEFAARGPASLPGRELWPGTYDLSDEGGQPIGDLRVTAPDAAAPWEPETAYWRFNHGRSLAGVDRFEIRPGSAGPATPDEASLVHPNAAFVATTAAAVPMDAAVWYTWSRVAPGRAPLLTGQLGVTPGDAQRAWRLTWVSTLELAGTLARLAPGEVFRFQKIASAPTWPSPSTPVALAVDVSG